MSYSTESLPGGAFLAFPEMAERLREELKGRFGLDSPPQPQEGSPHASFDPNRTNWYGDLLYCPGFPQTENAAEVPYWARTALLRPFHVRFDSIGDAAKALQGIQRNWASYQYQGWRRAEYIQQKLPFLSTKIRTFPFEFPATPMGIFTLLDSNTMLASAATSSNLPLGKIEFREDHKNPPSRAYLKLQESLTLAHHFFHVPFPHEGQRCFDAGACPGGWTWVLRELGADVFAVDRTELVPKLMNDRHVTFRMHDAFTLTPQELGAFDWVVSDVICYPERLLPWIRSWIDSGLTRNMICTIKLQGTVDWRQLAQFTELPNSRVVHLNYNKHELTFLWSRHEMLRF